MITYITSEKYDENWSSALISSVLVPDESYPLDVHLTIVNDLTNRLSVI